MIKTQTIQMIDVSDWDDLVVKTYDRSYSFQQQDGCKDRGKEYVSVLEDPYDYENDTVPEVVNHREMGVSFEAWLKRDPKAPLTDKEENCREDQWAIDMWWERNFYPSADMIAKDLHERGLLDDGEHVICIDW